MSPQTVSWDRCGLFIFAHRREACLEFEIGTRCAAIGLKEVNRIPATFLNATVSVRVFGLSQAKSSALTLPPMAVQTSRSTGAAIVKIQTSSSPVKENSSPRVNEVHGATYGEVLAYVVRVD